MVQKNYPNLDQAIAWTESIFPGFFASAEGASAEQIGELEKLHGKPLHSDYRRFLELFGKDAGFSLFRYDMSLARLAKFYRKPKWSFPASFTLIGTLDGDTPMELYLESNVESPSGYYITSAFDPDFSGDDWEEMVSRLAGTLPEFIFSAAFQALREKFPFGGSFGHVFMDAPPIKQSTAKQLMERLGFTIHPASWPMHEYAFKFDAACEFIYWGPSAQIAVQTKTQNELHRITQIVRDTLKVPAPSAL